MVLKQPVFVAVAILLALSGQALAQPAVAAPCNLIQSSERRQAGLEALRGGRYAAAATALQASLDACPGQHTVLLDLSRAHLLARDFPRAIGAAERFVELEPGAVDGRLALANAYLMAQRLQGALREAGAALKTDPAQASALKLKGNVEYLLGQLDNALSTFVTLLEHHPNDEEGPYMLGRIYFQESRIDHAKGQFERVLKINPKSYKAYDNLGLDVYKRQARPRAIRTRSTILWRRRPSRSRSEVF